MLSLFAGGGGVSAGSELGKEYDFEARREWALSEAAIATIKHAWYGLTRAEGGKPSEGVYHPGTGSDFGANSDTKRAFPRGLIGKGGGGSHDKMKLGDGIEEVADDVSLEAVGECLGDRDLSDNLSDLLVDYLNHSLPAPRIDREPKTVIKTFIEKEEVAL